MMKKIILLLLACFYSNLQSAEKPIEKLSSAEEIKEKCLQFAQDLRGCLNKETHFMFGFGGIDLAPINEKQFLKGPRPGVATLKRHYSPQDDVEVTRELLRQLVKEYKIHLMPKDEDLSKVAVMLLKELETNPLLQNLVGGIKIKAMTTQCEQLKKEMAIKEMKEAQKKDWRETDYHNLPRIVIYVGGGREAAQRVLNEIYRIFKNVEGMNRGPGFNQRITSLIYVSQGNRDDKIKNLWIFFEPNLIYYRANVTGIFENYHLTIPVG